ncbi:CLUMA_CG011478, isoform A [Clunio marinus]|uniref:CLUMA_CG011478, isoform A n=1 Tax=Clunio marinus TaxID=568069 RepID=A0A1J1IGD8_9DIPT|nr:CLUMA_CG011478, isoform A [Clunio marinus]
MNEVNDSWTPFKQLQQYVESFICKSSHESNLAKFDSLLRKNRHYFASILTNPPKNDGARKEIQQGISSGVVIPGFGQTKLSTDLVDEAITLSDMYNLNEFISLELLTTAQQQMSHYPGLPRGLIAILLYYDGKKSLVLTLKSLMQARLGVSWCTDVSYDISALVTNYTDSLVAEGLLKKIIDALDNLDITKELELLAKNRALGPPKHHRMVLDLYEEIRQNLAIALFNYSAQSGLPKDITIDLIHYLKKSKVNGARGEIDDVTVTLMMALLYAIDISAIHRREDGDEIVRRLPLVNDPDYIENIMQELIITNEDPSSNSNLWQCAGLRSLAIFALGLTCGNLRLAPQNLYPSAQQIIDKDEELVEIGIHFKVFEFLHFTFLQNNIIYKTEFFYRRLHYLFTDFIEIMHSKVTELRARADETARIIQNYQQQGLEPPNNIDVHFSNFLYAIGKFYRNDELNLHLNLEYWGPMEFVGKSHRSSSRSVCLFKFIRLAGELLPQILFIPYLKMLSGLSGNPQAARNAFNLLKQGNGSSGTATVSWDHFFTSLARYYQTLRHEQQPSTDTIYRSKLFSRNIDPQEIAALQAVLEVIRTVATHDEVARISLCEQPSYAPMPVMLGLISCSIVIPLKAELILTLAALARSSETAVQLWNLLEASQIICTIPSTQNFGNRGIESELEEIESRNETYPLTQSILELFHTLSGVIIPRALGAGPRKPGLDPYITFIIDSVFVKFYNRNYKNPEEKWEIAEKCLKIFDFFLKIYEPSSRDFPINNVIKEENPPPGFHIMLSMNTKTEFLRLILHLINEACIMFDTYAPFAGKKQLKNAVLHALNIVEMSLIKQESFFDSHFTASSSIFISGLNKLILDINPRSGKSDHVLNIAKMVTYNAALPKHSLQAIRILRLLIRHPNVNSQLLGMFTFNDKIKLEIRQGFVECLENEIFIDNEDEDCGIEIKIKEEILLLLRDSLPQAAPNVAHYLLGFDVSKDIRLSNLQHPGVLDFPSTCSKSLILLLDHYLEDVKSNRVLSNAHQILIESAYSLIYQLCFNVKTSEVFLRYLRSSGDFLIRHIMELPFKNSNESHHVLNQMTGLLKSVAIELKVTSEKNQLSQFGNLCKVLLGMAQTSMNTQNHHHQLELGHYLSFMTNDASARKKTFSSKLLICELLNSLDLDMKPLERPKWDYFDNSLMQHLFNSSETVLIDNGIKLIDVKKVHSILKEELNSVQATVAAGQRQDIIQEIESIMTHALNMNQQKISTAANAMFLEAWSQVTEIIFSVNPSFYFNSDVKQHLIIEILQCLLKYLVPAQVSHVFPDLSNIASSTVLLLLMNLRSCFGKKLSSNENASFLNKSPSNLNFTLDNIGSSPKSNTLHLKYIFRNIIEWIIVSGAGSQKLRMNLYAALLNFIYIIKGDSQSQKLVQFDDQKKDFYVSRLDRTIMKRNEKLDDDDDDVNSQIEMASEILNSFGDKLTDILCHDCTGGHDVVKMLALSCIDLLLDIDTMTHCIHFVSSRGYLSNIIDSLLKADQKLCHILDNQPVSLKALYVYESKMTMLSRFGGSYIGAELLLEHRVISILSQMKVFDLHPDFKMTTGSNMMENNSFIPSIETRYQQILFPALNLCDVILLTLGPENQSVITQITHFLLSHADTIEIVLRAGTPQMSLGLLQELSALTGLIARVANQNISEMIDPRGSSDMGAQLFRLQKLMMTLFPRFLVKELSNKSNESTSLNSQMDVDGHEHLSEIEKQWVETKKARLQIAANITFYARNCIANYSVDHRATKVLFSVRNEHFHGGDSGTIETSPELNLVVMQLKHSVEFYQSEKLTYDELVRQKNILSNITLNATSTYQNKFLSDKLYEKLQSLKLSAFITENCLYLLWTHLDYYMLRSISPTVQFNGFSSSSGQLMNTVNNIKVTSDDIGNLKLYLVNIFNETFSKQILATTQDQFSNDKGFMDALLRRIKRLIQFVPVQ